MFNCPFTMRLDISGEASPGTHRRCVLLQAAGDNTSPTVSCRNARTPWQRFKQPAPPPPPLTITTTTTTTTRMMMMMMLRSWCWFRRVAAGGDNVASGRA